MTTTATSIRTWYIKVCKHRNRRKLSVYLFSHSVNRIDAEISQFFNKPKDDKEKKSGLRIITFQASLQKYSLTKPSITAALSCSEIHKSTFFSSFFPYLLLTSRIHSKRHNFFFRASDDIDFLVFGVVVVNTAPAASAQTN